MSGERGQALVFAALLLGIAGIALVGLRTVSDLLLDDVRDDRAGEAGVAAAAATVADLLTARTDAIGRDLDRAETAELVAEPAVAAGASAAAARLARLQGRADPSDVRVQAFGFDVEVRLRLGRHEHVALIAAAP